MVIVLMKEEVTLPERYCRLNAFRVWCWGTVAIGMGQFGRGSVWQSHEFLIKL